MAYKALYRTYRPNTFDEVAGQKHIVQTLKNTVKQHKIAHAYLFCGPRGTGKTSIAKIFAKAVNCTSETEQPCMSCENCLAITDGTHPDIIEIDAASNNGVEEVRNLIEKVKYAPIKGKYKVYIIDEVHMMSAGAFNALLKTIEEPPEHVIFILATTEPHKVLPTIISRCQRYDFTKVPSGEIIKKIKSILDQEKIQCEDEVIRIVAQLSDGGMRDALSIMDQCIAYAQNQIQVHHINEIYGILTVEEKIKILDMVIQKDACGCINLIRQLSEKSMDVKRLTMDLIELIKESVIYDHTKEESLLHTMTRSEAEHLISQSDLMYRYQMIDMLMDTYDKYRNAADMISYFEVCLLKMMDHPQHQNKKMDVDVEEKQQNQQKEEILNVSRETILQDKINEIEENMQKKQEVVEEILNDKSALPLDDEFVLRLLVGANKPEKQKDQKQFEKINDYTMELQWAQSANLLKHGKIFASGTTYLVVIVNSQAEANEINDKDSKDEFLDFCKELFQKKKKVFAITAAQSQQVTSNFRSRMAEGTLPKPMSFSFTEAEETIIKEKTKEEYVLDLFGENNVVITEE